MRRRRQRTQCARRPSCETVISNLSAKDCAEMVVGMEAIVVDLEVERAGKGVGTVSVEEDMSRRLGCLLKLLVREVLRVRVYV